MFASNPKYTLKNYILQEEIDKAENGDNTLVNDLLKLAQNLMTNIKSLNDRAKATPSKSQAILFFIEIFL